MLLYLLINKKITKNNFIKLATIINDANEMIKFFNIMIITKNIDKKYFRAIFKIINPEDLHIILLQNCKEGNLHNVKFLLKNIKKNKILFDIRKDDEIYFRKACASGKLILVKYLVHKIKILTTHNVNINAHHDDAFKKACKHNHNDIVKYLYYLSKLYSKPININAGSSYCFRMSCKNGNMFLISYLNKIGNIEKQPINIAALNCQAFFWAYKYNSTNIFLLNYLWKLYKKNAIIIDIHINDDELFVQACEENNLPLINFLKKICPDYYEVVVNEEGEITNFSKINNLNRSLQIVLNNKNKKDSLKLLGITKSTDCKINKINKADILMCSICYTKTKELNINNYLIKLNCDHIYCLECLLLSNNTHCQFNALIPSTSNIEGIICAYCKKYCQWKLCHAINKK